MGWFLSSKKPGGGAGKKVSARSAAAKAAIPPRVRLGLVLRAGGGLLALALLAGGWCYGEQALLDYARRRQLAQAQPLPLEVELIDAPSWMSTGLKEQIQQLAVAHVSPDPLDRQSLLAAASALKTSPWVAQVQRVQRVSPARLQVQVTFRVPSALVERDSRYHLVDTQGVLLPGTYAKDQVGLVGLPIIRGVHAQPGQVGDIWPGDDLQAGLSLASFIAQEPYAYQVQAYDVSDRDSWGRVRLVMQTANGQVVWGLPPGQEKASEPPATVKREWIADVYQQRGVIDAGGKVVEVYGPTVFIHTAQGQDPAAAARYTSD